MSSVKCLLLNVYVYYCKTSHMVKHKLRFDTAGQGTLSNGFLIFTSKSAGNSYIFLLYKL